MVYATAPGTRAVNLWDGAGLARTQARRHGVVFPLKIVCLRTDFGGQKTRPLTDSKTSVGLSFFEERRKTQNQNKRNDDRLLIVEVAAATDPVARDACLVRMDDDEGGAPKKRAKTQSVCPTPGELIK